MDLRRSPCSQPPYGFMVVISERCDQTSRTARRSPAAGGSALRRSGLKLGGRASSVDIEPLPFEVLLPFSSTRGCTQDELGDLSPQNNRRTGPRGSRVRMHGRPGGTGCTTVETRRGQPENDSTRRKEGLHQRVYTKTPIPATKEAVLPFWFSHGLRNEF
jgi:hypothetical protein